MANPNVQCVRVTTLHLILIAHHRTRLIHNNFGHHGSSHYLFDGKRRFDEKTIKNNTADLLGCVVTDFLMQ